MLLFARGGCALLVGAALLVSCGGGGGGSGDDTPDSHGLMLSLSQPGKTYAPGEVMALAIIDGPRTGTFEARVDSVDVVIGLDADRGDLVAFTPAVAPGAHNLIVTNGDTRAVVPIAIASYEAIADSEMYVNDLVARIDASLAAAAAQETDADALAMIADRRAQLAMVSAQLPALTPAERDMLAYALRELVIALPIAHSLPVACPELMELVTKNQKLAAAIGAVAIGIVATYVPGGQLFGGLVAGIGLGYILANTSEAKELVATIIDKCVVPDSLTLGGASIALASSPSLAPLLPATTLQFEHGVAKSVGVSTSYVVDNDAKATILQTKQVLTQLRDRIPGNWLAGFPAVDEVVTKSGAPDTLALGSSGGFDGTMQRSGASLTFTFRFPTAIQAGEPQSFMFDLNYGTQSFYFSATLAPKCESPLFLCANGCTESSDIDCGSCGHECLGGQACVSDNCECPAQETLCNGMCVNTMWDLYNCGSCGNYCKNGCSNGGCIPDPPMP